MPTTLGIDDRLLAQLNRAAVTKFEMPRSTKLWLNRLGLAIGVASVNYLARCDFEVAAGGYNTGRGRGKMGSLTDFLICSDAVRYKLGIFTTDGDFSHYRKHLPITLYVPSAA